MAKLVVTEAQNVIFTTYGDQFTIAIILIDNISKLINVNKNVLIYVYCNDIKGKRT